MLCWIENGLILRKLIKIQQIQLNPMTDTEELLKLQTYMEEDCSPKKSLNKRKKSYYSFISTYFQIFSIAILYKVMINVNPYS